MEKEICEINLEEAMKYDPFVGQVKEKDEDVT